MKKHITLFALYTVCIALACSIFSPNAQNQSNNQDAPSAKTTDSGQQNLAQNEKSPIIIQVYEFKEGVFDDDLKQPTQDTSEIKMYHLKYTISARQEQINLVELSGGPDPYIITTDGNRYGVRNLALLGGFGDSITLLPGVQVSSYFLNSHTYKYLGILFYIPAKLTPQKLVIPVANYSIDLPPLGTEKLPNTLMQTDRMLNFPANVAINRDTNVKVFNFVKTDQYIKIDFEIINNSTREPQYGFYEVDLVDSFGFLTHEISDPAHSECVITDNANVEPGKTKSGTLCFPKNSQGESSFYVLYFRVDKKNAPDNKAILIKP